MCADAESCKVEAMSIVLKWMMEDTPEEVRQNARHCITQHLAQLEHTLCLVGIKVMC